LATGEDVHPQFSAGLLFHELFEALRSQLDGLPDLSDERQAHRGRLGANGRGRESCNAAGRSESELSSSQHVVSPAFGFQMKVAGGDSGTWRLVVSM
jgi:hypothetical protein